MFRLFRQYDALREPWRMLTALSVAMVILVLGLVIRLSGFEGIGWMVTVIPIGTLIGLRMLYLRREPT